jgi:hypothetical protein
LPAAKQRLQRQNRKKSCRTAGTRKQKKPETCRSQGIKIVGKLDLDSLKPKTRPGKKAEKAQKPEKPVRKKRTFRGKKLLQRCMCLKNRLIRFLPKKKKDEEKSNRRKTPAEKEHTEQPAPGAFRGLARSRNPGRRKRNEALLQRIFSNTGQKTDRSHGGWEN